MSGTTSKSGKGATKRTARTSSVAKSSTSSKRVSTPKPASKKSGPSRTSKAERDRIRALLPETDGRYADLWDRGAGKAHATKTAAPVRVSLRSSHKKRLATIETQTGLDRQTILNRAIASGWEAIQMTGKSLDEAATKLRRQPSAAGGTVTLHPTTATLQLLRKAKHPNARSILLQTGLNVWNAA